MRSVLATSVLLLATLAAPAAAATFPEVIALPDGFRPEGITISGTSFYTGSLGGAGIYRGDLRTGEGEVIIPGAGRAFVGMKIDRFGRLWVAGGATGRGYLFDTRTGTELAMFQLTTPATPTSSFVNDVVVTNDAAWFTESRRPVLYRVDLDANGAVGDASELDLTGEVPFVPGVNNFNGIDATPDGRTLVVVNSSVGQLFAVDPASATADVIDLGGASVAFGDGILLHGRTLYVVRNRLNQISVIELTPDLRSGVVADVITSTHFDVPTTIARFGSALYAVNARFTTPPGASTAYWVTRVAR